MNQTLDQKLATLKLGRMRQVYPSWVEQAMQSELVHNHATFSTIAR